MESSQKIDFEEWKGSSRCPFSVEAVSSISSYVLFFSKRKKGTHTNQQIHSIRLQSELKKCPQMILLLYYIIDLNEKATKDFHIKIFLL